jgi:shikimate kinase
VSKRTYQNVALIGFMGTGKSSVGWMVAEQLRFAYVDTDHLIEQSAGKSISEIFAQDGEDAFRRYEQQVVEQLKERPNSVIATGGGLGANETNLASLKTHALVVCLWASPETIWERVRSQTHRPLLQTPDPLQTIRDLLSRREAVYRQADILLSTELRSLREVAHNVVYQFQSARKTTVENRN